MFRNSILDNLIYKESCSINNEKFSLSNVKANKIK